MKRLLCIVSVMNAGGAETFLMKMFRGMDRTEYVLDFCVTARENHYAEEIAALGGKIYVVPPKSRHPFACFNGIRKLVKAEQYDAVIRVNEHSLSTLDLIAARMGGAKTV
ncbi:MAG: glycosyltransferase family 1 protein, partial [Clostridia bacterium]|nr:glycosyltransferase family 1 protein [Clostridia bacterium]